MWVGPRMKLPSAFAGGFRPSASSLADTKAGGVGIAGGRGGSRRTRGGRRSGSWRGSLGVWRGGSGEEAKRGDELEPGCGAEKTDHADPRGWSETTVAEKGLNAGGGVEN